MSGVLQTEITDAVTDPGANPTGPGVSVQKTGAVKTIQINLSGTNVQNIDEQVTHTTTTKYMAPWFTLKISEKGKDKLDKLLKAGDRVGVRNFVVAHTRLRFNKLESGKEGELYQEAIVLFETMLWRTSLGIP